jgi:hypothetical protein
VAATQIAEKQTAESYHLQQIEKAEEERCEAACGFGEIGESCNFAVLRKGLAEFEVAFTNP